jgi:hypothetical protein
VIGSVEELRRYLHTVAGGGATDDALLTDLLAAASDRFISLVPDRTLEPLPALRDAGEGADPRYIDDEPPVTLEFTTRARSVQVPDLREVVSITVDGVEQTDYRLRARRGEPALWVRLGAAAGIGVPGVLVPATTGVGFYDSSSVDRDVSVTGRWGPAVVAPRVKEAILIWAARVYHERAARWSDARQDPEGGVASYFRRIPPSIEAVVNGLKVPGA